VKKILITALAAAGLSAVTAAPAFATSPHFTYAEVTGVSADSVTVAFKEAGLGNSLDSVTISVSGDAQCVNPGGNDPNAGNKTAFSVSGVFGVSNGQSTGSETLTATGISPKCSPPMVIAWSDLVVTDATTGDSVTVPAP
jgi:hypothetical protein